MTNWFPDPKEQAPNLAEQYEPSRPTRRKIMITAIGCAAVVRHLKAQGKPVPTQAKKTMYMQRVWWSDVDSSVHGQITNEALGLEIATMERAEYLIPQGLYEIEVTYSPKFKTMMPLLKSIYKRDGIRIHAGTNPTHSTGCILTTLENRKRVEEAITERGIRYLRIR